MGNNNKLELGCLEAFSERYASNGMLLQEDNFYHRELLFYYISTPDFDMESSPAYNKEDTGVNLQIQ